MNTAIINWIRLPSSTVDRLRDYYGPGWVQKVWSDYGLEIQHSDPHDFTLSFAIPWVVGVSSLWIVGLDQAQAGSTQFALRYL